MAAMMTMPDIAARRRTIDTERTQSTHLFALMIWMPTCDVRLFREETVRRSQRSTGLFKSREGLFLSRIAKSSRFLFKGYMKGD